MKDGHFVRLNDSFIIKGSEDLQVLYDLRRGHNYDLDSEQYELVKMCDGEHTLESIYSKYDSKSLGFIQEFVSNLINKGAIELLEEPIHRTPSSKLVSGIRLESVHLEASGRCNMSCAHCYQGRFLDSGDSLSFDEIISLLDQMSIMQVSNVGVSGGEPLLLPKLFEILQQIEKRDMRISSIFTNGLLVNQEIVNKISQLRSNPTFFVSFDSIDTSGMIFRGFKKEKDSIVAIRKIIESIKILTSNGVRVVLNTVVNSGNIDNLMSMYKVVEGLGVSSWRLGFPKLTERFKGYSNDFQVEWLKIAERCLPILNHHLQNNRPFNLQIEYLFREALFDGSSLNLSDDDLVCDYEGRLTDCCVKPDGGVVSCAYCSDMPIGNIKQESLHEIWYSATMRNIKTIRIGDVSECKDCNLKVLCGTGCRANAYFLHGDFYNAKDDYACQAVQFFSDKILPLLKHHRVI